MDANERLAFINRLNSLSGDQAREALKQMTMHCNTKHTTIARALRNAVDQHAPNQYDATAAAQPSPAIAATSNASYSVEQDQRADQENVTDRGEERGGDDNDGGDDGMTAPTKKRKKKHKTKGEDINADINSACPVPGKSKKKREKAQKEDPADQDDDRSPVTFGDRKTDKMAPTKHENSSRSIKRNEPKETRMSVLDTGNNEAFDKGSSDEEDTNSEDSIHAKHDRHKDLRISASSKPTAQQDKRPAPASSVSVSRKETKKHRKTAVSDHAGSAEKAKVVKEQTEGASTVGPSIMAVKRKANENDEVGHGDLAEDFRGRKKVRTTRSAANSVPVIHVSMPANDARHRPGLPHIPPATPLSTPRYKHGSIQNHTDKDAELNVKKMSDGQTGSLSPSVRKAKTAHEEAMPPSTLVKASNSLSHRPTQTPVNLDHQKQGEGATSHGLPLRPAQRHVTGLSSPQQGQVLQSRESKPFRPQSVPSNAGEREYKCRYCHKYYRPLQNYINACRRHDGHTVKLSDAEIARVEKRYEAPTSKRKWSGCGHWVRHGRSDGCISTPHRWNNFDWRILEDTSGKAGQ